MIKRRLLILKEKTPTIRCEASKLQDSDIQEDQIHLAATLFSDRKSLVLWRHPFRTIYYFLREVFIHISNVLCFILQFRKTIFMVTFVAILIALLNIVDGPHQQAQSRMQKKVLFCLYWFVLGVLSSFGLGTGFHTFALYLGPYIASVTRAESVCGSLKFLDDSYTDESERPPDDPRWIVTLWSIMCKVRLASWMWGLGTAIGELPSYYMGRAARLSQQDQEEDILREFSELQRKKDLHPESLTSLDKMKLMVRDLVKKAGFLGILVCASIPNPLFDLVGLTCGSFLVPFWTFFSATLIGKTMIKTTLQQVFVIIVSNEVLISTVAEWLYKIPLVGNPLQRSLPPYLSMQQEKYRLDQAERFNQGEGFVSKMCSIFSIAAFLYSFVSIINSLAQNHHKRLRKQQPKWAQSNDQTNSF